MRAFWFFPAVPRPDASFLAVHGLTLGTYLAFRDLDVAVAELPFTAFNLAVAVFFTALFARNALLNPKLTENRLARAVTLCVTALVPFAVLSILRHDVGFAIQIGVTAWGLLYAALLLFAVNWMRDDLPLLSNVWARDTRINVPALTIVAASYALRALVLAALALWSTELAWIVFLTLGWVVLGFLVNWVIVMMVVARLDDGD